MTHKNEWAVRPPMGWNSWDCYGASVNEEQVRGNADYMAAHLKDYGWEYVVVDIEWSQPDPDGWDYRPFTDLCMDEYSRLIPAAERFPSAANGQGFKPLSDYVHSLGLKFGIHIMRGIPRQAVHRNCAVKGTDRTARQIASRYSVCPWNTNMYGVDPAAEGAQAYYNSLFDLYAAWGVDFVKVDDCGNTEYKPHDPYSAEKEIELIRHAIDQCGRAIVLSLSPGPAPIDHAWHLCENANMWRMTGDFWDGWKQLYDVFERCEKWAAYVKEGCWPDGDMLPLGWLTVYRPAEAHMTNFTPDEQRTLINQWCIFRSPLMMGGEMRRNDAFTLGLLTNAEALYINQHGSTPRQLFRDKAQAGWTNTDDKGRVYLGLYNLSDTERAVAVKDLPAGTVYRDVWEDAVYTADQLMNGITLRPHASILVAEQK